MTFEDYQKLPHRHRAYVAADLLWRLGRLPEKERELTPEEASMVSDDEVAAAKGVGRSLHGIVTMTQGQYEAALAALVHAVIITEGPAKRTMTLALTNFEHIAPHTVKLMGTLDEKVS